MLIRCLVFQEAKAKKIQRKEIGKWMRELCCLCVNWGGEEERKEDEVNVETAVTE